MSCLVIHQGTRNTELKDNGIVNYLYCIGSGQVTGRNFIHLNCADELYDQALNLRDPYTEWVYGLNKEFLSHNLIRDGLSLFFLTDLSNKRNELFDTYETIANLLHLKKRLQGESIEQIELYGVDDAFLESVCSIFPGARAVRASPTQERVRLVRRVLADSLYFCRVLGVIGINKLHPRVNRSGEKKAKKKYFFSFFPQMFDAQLAELRYRNMVGPEDGYIVTIIADGMHQKISTLRYKQLARTLPSEKFVLIDREFRIRDLLEAVRRYWSVHQYAARSRKSRYVFQGINVSRYIRQELLWSAGRIGRLTVVEEALNRTLVKLQLRELVYPIFEFAFGRMISALIGEKYKGIVRTGFNHGDYSWRFINYFLAKGEASSKPPYLNHCPIPDKVLAEDQLCSEIYRYNGYCNVSIMEKVTRLDYLQEIRVQKLDDFSLIVAGLHDGEALAAYMREVVVKQHEIRFLFKPHPRANNVYLKTLPSFPNFEVVDSPIKDLLEFVGQVYVTYSGVGVEAARLGIPTTLVHMPGRISWSKLLDYQGDKSGETNTLLGLEGGSR
tara:strand:+ start:1666 stop:3333 length:1668 start_codon:yes stop_codon:yes gene_type:complete